MDVLVQKQRSNGSPLALPKACAGCLILGAIWLSSTSVRAGEEKTDPIPPKVPAPLQVTTSGGPMNQRNGTLDEHSKSLPTSNQDGDQGLISDAWTTDDKNGNGAKILFLAPAKSEKDARGRLAVELLGGKKARTIISCEGAWRIKRKEVSSTTLVIYNATPATMKASIVFCYGRQFTWFQSPTVDLRPGWNTIQFSQSAANFKGHRTGWRPTGRLPALQDCREIKFIFHSGNRKGRLFIEAITPELGENPEPQKTEKKEQQDQRTGSPSSGVSPK